MVVASILQLCQVQVNNRCGEQRHATHSFAGKYKMALNETPDPESPEKWCHASGLVKSLKKAL
jgi:hypothetical protein